ncbi:MAG: GTP 3',8-cyclase MoaA [Candidatus Eremiobacterota bacterium]
MIDKWKRQINYLRISITDRCNLRCIYCMPPEGIVKKNRKDILSYEEIKEIASICVEDFGIRKIRLTGGEPLVRPDMEKLVFLLRSIDKLEELTLTTNGILLPEKAKLLKEAGIKRLNISLDTLNREKFRRITGRDELKQVLAGIDRALNTGFFPVKINTVLMKGINDDEVSSIVNFCLERNLEIRFIEFMNMGTNIYYPFYISTSEIKKILEREFSFTAMTQRSHIAEEYIIRRHNKETITGFISPVSHMFCNFCNRIRMNSTGDILPCLMDSKSYNLKDFLTNNNKELLKNTIKKAIMEKPFHHTGRGNISMYSIGG